ncbi:MAG: cytochrome c biogenesis CcdA family protein [Nakamurella sp.]
MGGITDTVVSGPFAVAGLLAVAAGLVSFASPCVVPLVPGYLAYLVGLVGSDADALPARRSSVQMQDGQTQGNQVHAGQASTVTVAPRTVRWRAVGAAGLFVAGFSIVFIAESALVLGVYTSFIANQALLVQISGVVSIVMGLVLALPALQREWRPGIRARGAGRGGNTRRRRGADRLWGAPILGAAFGTGWLACTSPTLAGIIALSTATEWNGSAVRGLVLVMLYCAGLGIPFMILALGFGWAGSALTFLRAHARGIQLGGAIVLVAIGVAMLTGLWGYLLAPLQGTVLLL